MKIKIFGTVNDSIVDGPGLRYTIFTQGCTHHCLGCHNPESHDLNGGELVDTSRIITEILENPLLDGITLSGGEPMLQVEPLKEICQAIKPLGLNIVIYSGFTYEQIVQDKKMRSLLELGDVLVDGKFEIEQRSLNLLYRGSKNQRLINIQASLVKGIIVEYVPDEDNQLVI